jgi:hypothetical protein
MADTKITDLTAITGANLATGDELVVVDVSDTTMAASGTNKSTTLTDIVSFLQARGMPRVTRLGTQHSISSTTGTEVTDLQQTLEAGTYTFTYALIVRSATATVSPMLGVNFTGTGSPRMHFRFADATSAITAEVHTMDNEGVLTFGYISGMATNTETTTAPNMGTTATNAVAATATDILCFIEGIIVVTGSGDLELWHSSETATNTSVEVGSSLVVVRTA